MVAEEEGGSANDDQSISDSDSGGTKRVVNCRRSRAITADSVAEVAAWEHQKEPAGVQNAYVYVCISSGHLWAIN